MSSPALGQPGALFNDPATSVTFNGTTQFAQVPYAAGLNPSMFSVEVWAFPTGGAGTYHGVLASYSYPLGWVLYRGQDGGWEFWVNSGSTMTNVWSDAPATPNTWYHLVGTFNGANVILYVNGVAAATTGVATGYQAQSGNPLEIAQSDPVAILYFPGRLEEAAVYGTALSAAQVQRHYSVGTSGR
jgi:hypothetical protein